MFRSKIQKLVTISAVVCLPYIGNCGSARASSLTNCFDRLPTDRTWTSELILHRSSVSQDAEFEGGISDGTSDESEALLQAAKEFRSCVVAAVVGHNVSFGMSITIHSERDGDLVASKPDRAKTRGRVPLSNAPTSTPVKLGESHSTARCLGGLAPGQSWRMVWVISRAREVATSTLPWTLTIDLPNKPSTRTVNGLTQFARCMAASWTLPGGIAGPLLRENSRQLIYAGEQ